MKLFHKLLQAVRVMLIPLGRNALRTAPQINLLSLFGLGQRRLKRLPAGHSGVDVVPVIHSMQREVCKRPFTRIKAIPLVDKMHCVLPLAARLKEDCLPAIGVPGPLIEYDHSSEIGSVSDLGEVDRKSTRLNS